MTAPNPLSGLLSGPLLCLLPLFPTLQGAGAAAADPVPAQVASPAEEPRLPSPGADEADTEGWRKVDGVMLIINEEIITMRRFMRDLTRIQRMGGISTQQDREATGRWLMFDKVRRKVMVQAGQDMGLDPRLVQHQVDNVLEREIESSGGVEGYVERMRGERSDSHERKEQWTDDLYSITWEAVQTGEQAGPLGRLTRDRYVRPGIRRFVYTQVVDTPAWYGELGGNAPGVEFQELLIAHERHGGVDAARQLAVKVREQALQGSNFDDLMRAVGEPRADGFLTRADEKLVGQADRALSAFLTRAQPGDISEVYAPRNGRLAAFAVARFVQRVEAMVPPFEEPEVQLQLDKRTREGLDQTRRARALEELLRAAYVWPPEARAPQPETAPEAEGPEALPKPSAAQPAAAPAAPGVPGGG